MDGYIRPVKALVARGPTLPPPTKSRINHLLCLTFLLSVCGREKVKNDRRGEEEDEYKGGGAG